MAKLNMTKKKKPTSNILIKKAEQKQLNARFLERIKFIAKAMIGEEKFKLIPRDFLEEITALRVPGLKAKAAPGSDILKSTVTQYNKLLTELINEHTIETNIGKTIPLGWYFTEGIVLLDQISLIENADFANAVIVKNAFQQYLPDSEHYASMGNVLDITIRDADVLLSEADKHGIIYSDMTDIVYNNPESASNAIFIDRMRPEKAQILIDDHSRTIIKIGWVSSNKEWVHPSIKPAQIGFKGEGADIPLPIYIQKHAIDNLQTRIDITPGIMFYALSSSFIDGQISYAKGDNQSKVAYYLSEQKVGYLLCKWFDNKIVIITFLFLTNDGTPEAKKLKELLSLEKADKKYLQIDNLPHFNSYNFENNKLLSAVFTAAGCGSLLKLGHLQEFSKKSIANKDPESIKKYISDFSIRQKGIKQSNL